MAMSELADSEWGDWVTVREAAERLGIPVQTLHNAIRAGKIRHRRVGSRPGRPGGTIFLISSEDLAIYKGLWRRRGDVRAVADESRRRAAERVLALLHDALDAPDKARTDQCIWRAIDAVAGWLA